MAQEHAGEEPPAQGTPAPGLVAARIEELFKEAQGVEILFLSTHPMNPKVCPGICPKQIEIKPTKFPLARSTFLLVQKPRLLLVQTLLLMA